MKPGFIIFCLVLLSLPLHCHAERRANGGDQALKRMQYMMKQMQQENRMLTADKKQVDEKLAQVNKDLDKAHKDLGRKQATIDRFQHSNESLNKRIKRLTARNDKTVAKLKDVVVKYRDLVLLIRELKLAGQKNIITIAQRDHRIGALGKKNHALFELNRELMMRYQGKGIADAIDQHEPFTGLKQVEMENLLQEYRFRNEDNQVKGDHAAAAR